MNQTSYDGAINYWKPLKRPSIKDWKYYNHSVAEVVKVKCFAEEGAPLELKKTKYIIRKYAGDDFNPPKEVL